MQGGRFDCPDRLFSSVEDAYLSECVVFCLYSGACSSSTDFKECIPEMYYLPEMFTNNNHVDFGDEKIDNVLLPPWSHQDPGVFVSIMRAALESEYVSRNLNQWIDLIFGYKQRGEEAVNANNVFYPITYEVITSSSSSL